MSGGARLGWSRAEALAALDAHVNLETSLPDQFPPPSLDRTARLVELMGDPQRAYPVIHLTGTNGKGSTARMITSLLMSQGLSVGTYTSPDLQGVNERMTWNDAPVSDDALAEALESVIGLEPLVDGAPTRFEVLTAAAYRWFADVAVDVAVVEVGLGGRWDATNVADAAVAVVTNVSLDHAEILGPTLVDIAREKAGIVKAGSTLVLGEDDADLAPVFRQAASGEVWERGQAFSCRRNRAAHGGRLVDLDTRGASYDDVYLPVHGAHQGDNAAVALAAAEAFFGGPLSEDVVHEAFGRLRIPGRMEVVSRHPLTILDGAHNPAGAAAAGATLAEEFQVAGERLLVLGMLRGREPEEMIGSLGPEGIRMVIACSPSSPRAVPTDRIVTAAEGMGLEAVAAPSVRAALGEAMARAGSDDLVLVTGSLYVVGEARSALSPPPADTRASSVARP